MWIRSQNKKILVDVISFSIHGLLKKRAGIYGCTHSGAQHDLGTYQDEKTAMLELESIQDYISENVNGVYEMK